MNVNFDKYPELKLLTKSFNSKTFDDRLILGRYDSVYLKDQLYAIIEHHKIELNSNIDLISFNFYEEINKQSINLNRSGIHNVFCNHNPVICGVMLIDNLSIFYKMEIDYVEEQESLSYKNCFLFMFTNGMLVHYISFFEDNYNLNNNTNFINDVWHIEKTNINIKQFFSSPYFFQLFKKYAEVETKIFNTITNPKLRNKKAINHTPFKITQYTSSYFTNLIKTNAFSVKGHWRLQPYGVGRKELKLIWIDDFIKNGYNRDASINKN